MKRFKFTELSKKVQQQLIDKESARRESFDGDDFYPAFIDKLLSFGIKTESDNILYSGFGCQGNGLSFYGVLYFDMFFEKHPEYSEFHKEKLNGQTLKIIRQAENHFYVHEKTVRFEKCIDLKDNSVYCIPDDFYNILEKIRIDCCLEFYDTLYTGFLDCSDEKLIREYFTEEDLFYSADGESFTENSVLAYDYIVEFDEEEIEILGLTPHEIFRLAQLQIEIIYYYNELYNLKDDEIDKIKYYYLELRKCIDQIKHEKVIIFDEEIPKWHIIKPLLKNK